MINYIKHHEWKVIEDGFDPALNRISESLFSIGNGRMGQRANFEETYSGDSLRGSYIAGVYYPDKTRVGWWKNGYPEYFAKIINSVNWIGIRVWVDEVELDLNKVSILRFYRELDMQKGLLSRQATVEFADGRQLTLRAERFVSIVTPEAGALRYTVKPLNFSGTITVVPYLDGDVENEDANYQEKFWKEIKQEADGNSARVLTETLKTGFRVGAAMSFRLLRNGHPLDFSPQPATRPLYAEASVTVPVKKGEELTLEKLAVVVTSLNFPKQELEAEMLKVLKQVQSEGYEMLRREHSNRWAEKWETSDIRIEGDVAAQQGIRFNIFQLNQTYTGEDERLNIGPKGFTGEKYGGVTYWDTEAYCLPFFLGTAPSEVSRNLLLYRYKHLPKAIENAGKLGFTDGAALYPMVTINGEECHNEWEITFEEIHRNGAIAYAIWNYINYTGDYEYLLPFGFEVLLGISRFWSQRVNWSDEKGAFVILGVTGPNEYENNVDNNYHTNNLAVWTLRFTLDVIDYLKKEDPWLYQEVREKLKFNEITETQRWKEIISNIHLPFDKKRGIFLQQENFLNKELMPAEKIDPAQRPINQHWSWDRILRSCYIKQADTLQSLFWFEDDHSEESLRRHFDFYEPLTVHESSLSPCVHAILAAKIGYREKAYELYLRTARLDLDDYNNDTADGLHVTSMGGTWMAFVMGFGGMRVKKQRLIFDPFLPSHWKSWSFRINFRGSHLEVKKTPGTFTVRNHSEVEVAVTVWGKEAIIHDHEKTTFKI